MKQYINLYKPKAIPVESPFSAYKIVQLWGGTFIILAIITITYFAFRQIEFSKLADSKKKSNAADSQLREVMQALATKKDVTALQNEIKALESERDAKNKMIGLLQTEGLDNANGFSEKMEDLAEQHVSGTWYKSFKIANGNKSLIFEGGTVDPDLVPKIVQGFGKSKHFKNKAFEYILVERAKEDDYYVSFILQTEQKGARAAPTVSTSPNAAVSAKEKEKTVKSDPSKDKKNDINSGFFSEMVGR